MQMMANDEIGVSIIHVFFEYEDDLITDSSNRSQQFPAFLIIVLVKTEVVRWAEMVEEYLILIPW